MEYWVWKVSARSITILACSAAGSFPCTRAVGAWTFSCKDNLGCARYYGREDHRSEAHIVGSGRDSTWAYGCLSKISEPTMRSCWSWRLNCPTDYGLRTVAKLAKSSQDATKHDCGTAGADPEGAWWIASWHSERAASTSRQGLACAVFIRCKSSCWRPSSMVSWIDVRGQLHHLV